jgi:DinB family protein
MFSASIEVGGDGWCTAWVPELPGCFVNLSSERAALRTLPVAILAYLRWLRRHGESVRAPGAVAVRVVERYKRPEPMRWGNYEVLHGFERRPLTRDEVLRLVRWMRFMRRDTLRLLDLLPADGLDWSRPGQTRTIGENLQHLARGELWYLSRVALGPPRPSAPHTEDPLRGLAQARSITVARLSRMTREERARITQADNQRWWSARKMLGRMLYHERYHIRSMARIARHHGVRVPSELGGWARY